MYGKMLILVLVVGLAACADLGLRTAGDSAPTRDSLQTFSLSGRFSLQHHGSAHSGRIDWRHDVDRDELIVSSPFGQAVAELLSDADGARLTTGDGRSYRAETPEELLQTVLGYPLPLRQLLAGLRGQGWDDRLIERDDLGRPVHWHDQEWRVAYQYDSDDPQALPGKLLAERPGDLQLRLRIDAWASLPVPR